MRIIEPSVQLRWVTPNALQSIEEAGRICYKSEEKITDESAKAFVRMLKKRKHEAMIEHACASFKWVCDRGVTHELVRHRLASYAQESTRFCNYSKEKFGSEISCIMPLGATTREEKEFDEAYKDAERHYMRLIDMGTPAQRARHVLPIGLKTEIVITTNFREWIYIFKMRTAKDAHLHIKSLGLPTQALLMKECLPVFEKEENHDTSND